MKKLTGLTNELTSAVYWVASQLRTNNRLKMSKLGYPERCQNHRFKTNCFILHYILWSIQVVFHSEKNCGCLLFRRILYVVLHLKKLRLSFIYRKMSVCRLLDLNCTLITVLVRWGRLPLKKSYGHLPFIKKNEVVFHILSSWVVIMLHTKNQLPRLPQSDLKCNVMVVFSYR